MIASSCGLRLCVLGAHTGLLAFLSIGNQQLCRLHPYTGPARLVPSHYALTTENYGAPLGTRGQICLSTAHQPCTSTPGHAWLLSFFHGAAAETLTTTPSPRARNHSCRDIFEVDELLRTMVTPANPSALPAKHEHGSAQQIRCVFFPPTRPSHLFSSSLFFFACTFSTDLPLHLFLISLLFFACIFSTYPPFPSLPRLFFFCLCCFPPTCPPSLPHLSSLFACIFSTYPPFPSLPHLFSFCLCCFPPTRPSVSSSPLFSFRLYFFPSPLPIFPPLCSSSPLLFPLTRTLIPTLSLFCISARLYFFAPRIGQRVWSVLPYGSAASVLARASVDLRQCRNSVASPLSPYTRLTD